MSHEKDPGDSMERAKLDPLIEEVRAARKWVWEQAGSSFEGLLEHLQKIEREHAKLVVREPPSPHYPQDDLGSGR